jgi:hypothetical protein
MGSLLADCHSDQLAHILLVHACLICCRAKLSKLEWKYIIIDEAQVGGWGGGGAEEADAGAAHRSAGSQGIVDGGRIVLLGFW